MDTVPLIQSLANEVCVLDHPLLALGDGAAVGETGEAGCEFEHADNDSATAVTRSGRHFFKWLLLESGTSMR